MTPLERKLVRRLVYSPEALSRNKNFHAFEADWAKAARRTAGLLRSLRTAMHDDRVQVSATEDAEAWQVVTFDPASGLRRVAHLRADELEILCEDPVCAARLDQPVSVPD